MILRVVFHNQLSEGLVAEQFHFLGPANAGHEWRETKALSRPREMAHRRRAAAALSGCGRCPPSIPDQSSDSRDICEQLARLSTGQLFARLSLHMIGKGVERPACGLFLARRYRALDIVEL